jgi:hypothetical protein
VNAVRTRCELPPERPRTCRPAHLTSSARGPGQPRTAQQLSHNPPLASRRTAPQTHDLRGGPRRIHGQTTSACIRRSVATEDAACDRRAPLARWRVPSVASGQPCRSARRSCRGRAGAPPAAWHALGAAAARPQRRQVAPRRAVSAPCHRAGAPGAPMLRHRRHRQRQPAGRQHGGPRKQSWPDPLRRRQESPAKRHHATAPVQGPKRWEKERSSWSGHSGSVLAYAFSKSCQQFRLVPGPDYSRQTGTSWRCAAVFCCCTRLVNSGLRISNLST